MPLPKILLFLFCLISLHCYGQKDKPNIKKWHRAKVIGLDNTKHIGIIASLNDSTVSLINFEKVRFILIPGQDTLLIQVKNIDRIKLRRKGAIGIGMATGILVGSVTGGILGYTLYTECVPDPSAPYGTDCSFDGLAQGLSTAGGTIVGLGAGAVIGAFMGSINRTIKIRGSLVTYQAKKKKLTRFQLRSQSRSD
jgi:hypothetical protein